MQLREVMKCNEFPSWRGRTGKGIQAASSTGSRGEMGSPKRTGTHVWLSYPQRRQGMHSPRLLPLPHFCKQLQKQIRGARTSLAKVSPCALIRPIWQTLGTSVHNRGCFQPFAGQIVCAKQFGRKGSSSSSRGYGNQERRLRSWGEIVDLWRLFLALLQTFCVTLALLFFC